MGLGCFPASASFRARERLALALGSPRRLARPERLRESDGRRRVLPRPAAGAPPPLAGRVAIVTGANSGIGLRARALASAARASRVPRSHARARAAEDVRAENPYALVTVLPSVPRDLARSRASALRRRLPRSRTAPPHPRAQRRNHALSLPTHRATATSSRSRSTTSPRDSSPRVSSQPSPRRADASDTLVSRRVVRVVSAAHRYAYPRGVRLNRLSGPAASVGYDPRRVRPIKTRRDVGRDGRRARAGRARDTRPCSSPPLPRRARFVNARARARASSAADGVGGCYIDWETFFEDCRRGREQPATRKRGGRCAGSRRRRASRGAALLVTSRARARRRPLVRDASARDGGRARSNA